MAHVLQHQATTPYKKKPKHPVARRTARKPIDERAANRREADYLRRNPHDAEFAQLDPCLKALLRCHLVWTAVFRPFNLQVVYAS